MIDKIVYGAGIVMICLIVLFVLWCFYMEIADYLGAKIDAKDYRSRSRQRVAKDIGAQLKTAAHWFSEKPEIHNALMLIGSQLVNFGHFDISSIREKVKELKGEKVKTN